MLRELNLGDTEILAKASGQSSALVEKIILDCAEGFIWLIDGEFVCAWGYKVYNFMTGDAVLWMYGSKRLKSHQMAFLRRNRDYCRRLAVARALYAFAEADFAVSRRWIEWMGFKLLGEFDSHGKTVAMFKFGG